MPYNTFNEPQKTIVKSSNFSTHSHIHEYSGTANLQRLTASNVALRRNFLRFSTLFHATVHATCTCAHYVACDSYRYEMISSYDLTHALCFKSLPVTVYEI